MATLDAEIVAALNALLEDTRASVEIELALTNGATELRERETLEAMGGEEILACCALRERLTLTGAPVTWRINGIVFHILGTERYDERLRAFARHQAAICEHVETLLDTVTDREAHRLLRELYDSHVLSARWAEQRANTFAATRLLDFTLPKAARLAAAQTAIEREPGPDLGTVEVTEQAWADGAGPGTNASTADPPAKTDPPTTHLEHADPAPPPDHLDGSGTSEGPTDADRSQPHDDTEHNDTEHQE